MTDKNKPAVPQVVIKGAPGAKPVPKPRSK